MAAPEGARRFECPADFEPCAPAPAPCREALRRSPSKRLWLIRAPAAFRPESLDGLAVPLLGSRTLEVPQPDGKRKLYSLQAARADPGSPHLLVPSGRQHHLACAPAFCGLLSVCERLGDPGADQPLLPVAARLAPRIPEGLRQRFLPFGGRPPSQAAEEPPRSKRRRKRRELHTEGYLGAPEEEPPPPLHKPCPGGAPVGPADPTPRSRKKRKQPLEEEAEEPSALPQQPAPGEPCLRESPQAGWAAEGPGHCRPKKRKRRQAEEAAEATEPSRGRHEKMEEQPLPWEPGVGAEVPGLPRSERSGKKHKKRRRHEREAAEEEESLAS